MRQKFVQSNVVILGSYIKQKSILDKLRILLEVQEYTPIIIEDIENIEHETPRQKIHSLLATCNFVIAEDTEPCGEIIELEYCRHVGVVTAIISRKYERSSWMTSDFEIHSRDFKVFAYRSEKINDLEKLLKIIIEWVRNRIKKRQKQMREIEKKMSKT